MSVPQLAKIVAFGKWKPQPNKLAIVKKADEVEHFFITSLVAIHALKDNSKRYLVDTVFGGDELSFNHALLQVAEIQIKDELDHDQSMSENIRRMACEIGQVDWLELDKCLQNNKVLEELDALIKALFPNGAEGESLAELALTFSEEMGGYFDNVSFSPELILEAYLERLKTIKTKISYQR